VELDALTVGIGTTVMVRVAELVQVPSVPTTVYIVVLPGETITLLPVNTPGFHV
jgi:hypothetical protein